MGTRRQWKQRWGILTLMKNCCHRLDGRNGNSTVNFCLALASFSRRGAERGRHRNGKRPGLSALRRREGDLVLGEIHVAHGDTGFAEATAGVKRDFEGGLHPLGVLGKCRLGRHNFRVSDLRLLRGLTLSFRSLAEAQQI